MQEGSSPNQSQQGAAPQVPENVMQPDFTANVDTARGDVIARDETSDPSTESTGTGAENNYQPQVEVGPAAEYQNQVNFGSTKDALINQIQLLENRSQAGEEDAVPLEIDAETRDIMMDFKLTELRDHIDALAQEISEKEGAYEDGSTFHDKYFAEAGPYDQLVVENIQQDFATTKEGTSLLDADALAEAAAANAVAAESDQVVAEAAAEAGVDVDSAESLRAGVEAGEIPADRAQSIAAKAEAVLEQQKEEKKTEWKTRLATALENYVEGSIQDSDMQTFMAFLLNPASNGSRLARGLSGSKEAFAGINTIHTKEFFEGVDNSKGNKTRFETLVKFFGEAEKYGLETGLKLRDYGDDYVNAEKSTQMKVLQSVIEAFEDDPGKANTAIMEALQQSDALRGMRGDAFSKDLLIDIEKMATNRDKLFDYYFEKEDSNVQQQAA